MHSGVDLKSIVDVLSDRVGAYLIILFGSYGKGQAREDSDIDIAFLADEECDSYETYILAQELAGMVGRDVDLVNLRMASTVMKAQIVSSGTVIYCTDEVRRMNYFMKTFKEYALLNEERAIVLREIERRGSIYGINDYLQEFVKAVLVSVVSQCTIFYGSSRVRLLTRLKCLSKEYISVIPLSAIWLAVNASDQSIPLST